MYAKIFSQIYDGTLCTHGPWEALVTFQQLLILADQDGCVDMTAHAISRRTTIPLDIIERGIGVLLQPDPDSRTPDEGGRRIVLLSEGRAWGWRIVNYVKYRQIKREEDRREYHRAYWHKRKDKAAQHELNTTQQTQPNQPIAEAEAEAKKVAIGEVVAAPTADAPRKRSAEKPEPRGSRLPQDWALPKAWGDWAVSELAMDPDLVRAEAAKFADYWHAAAGAKGRKADWLATWRVWCRKALEQPARQRSAPQQETFRERDERLQAERLNKLTGGLVGKTFGSSMAMFDPADVIEGEVNAARRIG